MRTDLLRHLPRVAKHSHRGSAFWHPGTRSSGGKVHYPRTRHHPAVRRPCSPGLRSPLDEATRLLGRILPAELAAEGKATRRPVTANGGKESQLYLLQHPAPIALILISDSGRVSLRGRIPQSRVGNLQTFGPSHSV